MKHAEPGSVSHGTLRPQDLIPAFMRALDQCANANCYTSDGDEMRLVMLNSRAHGLLADCERLCAALEGELYDDEVLDSKLEELSDLLNEYAPPGHYFGAHWGDGSDFGFWPGEDE